VCKWGSGRLTKKGKESKGKGHWSTEKEDRKERCGEFEIGTREPGDVIAGLRGREKGEEN